MLLFAPGSMQVHTIGSNYDTVVCVYSGQTGSLYLVGCDDDSGGSRTSWFDFTAYPYAYYYIVITSYSDVGGDMVVNVISTNSKSMP
jgi:hypothetical protein